MSDEAIHLDALARYSRAKIHLVDCMIAATAVEKKIPITSFDRDFRKLADAGVSDE